MGVALALIQAGIADAFIYWGDYSMGKIGRASLDGAWSDPDFIQGDGTAAPASVAVDGDHIFWSNYSAGGRIGRANLDGTGVDQSFITGASYPGAVAVDGSHIYWANSGTNSIARANLNGSGADLDFIQVTGELNGLGSIAVDGDHVYWTNGETQAIGRANLDGSGVNQSFISAASGLGGPAGIVVDDAHIYWGSTQYTQTEVLRSIARAGLNGAGVNTRFIDLELAPVSLAIDSSHLYWLGALDIPEDVAIGRANLDGTGVKEDLVPDLGYAGGVAVDAGTGPPPPPEDPECPTPEAVRIDVRLDATLEIPLVDCNRANPDPLRYEITRSPAHGSIEGIHMRPDGSSYAVFRPQGDYDWPDTHHDPDASVPFSYRAVTSDDHESNEVTQRIVIVRTAIHCPDRQKSLRMGASTRIVLSCFRLDDGIRANATIAALSEDCYTRSYDLRPMPFDTGSHWYSDVDPDDDRHYSFPGGIISYSRNRGVYGPERIRFGVYEASIFNSFFGEFCERGGVTASPLWRVSDIGTFTVDVPVTIANVNLLPRRIDLHVLGSGSVAMPFTSQSNAAATLSSVKLTARCPICRGKQGAAAGTTVVFARSRKAVQIPAGATRTLKMRIRGDKLKLLRRLERVEATMTIGVKARGRQDKAPLKVGLVAP